MAHRSFLARHRTPPFLLTLLLVLAAGCDADSARSADGGAPPIIDDGGPPPGDSATPTPSAESVEATLEHTEIVEAAGYDFAALNDALGAGADTLGGGGGLLLIHEGRVVYRRTVGEAPEGGAFTPNTVVPLASASKWLSGGVVGALVDRGELAWDTRAGEVFETWEGAKSRMTVAQLFSHTAGLNNGPEVHRIHRLDSMQTAVDRIYAEVPMEYEPGTQLWYAGVGMQVVGRMAEIRHARPWVEVADEVLFGPLGMSRTHYYGYVGANFEVPTDNPNVAGTAASSLNDYARYVWMLQNDGIYGDARVLQPETIEAMFTNRADVEPQSVQLSPWDAYYDVAPEFADWRTGIGTWLYANGESGETEELISGGAWGCMPFIDRTRNLAGIYLPYQRERQASPSGRDRNPATVFWLDTVRPLIRAAVEARP
ncbi:MAG: serine hydrolase domain-containing protein [Sandaracinaceae bacterium]